MSIILIHYRFFLIIAATVIIIDLLLLNSVSNLYSTQFYFTDYDHDVISYTYVYRLCTIIYTVAKGNMYNKLPEPCFMADLCLFLYSTVFLKKKTTYYRWAKNSDCEYYYINYFFL